MAAVNIILKNNGAAGVTVQLTDQYGGFFEVTIDPGMSQNQTVMDGSGIVINASTVHLVSAENDEGKEIVIAE